MSLAGIGVAHAVSSVEVLDTYPSGEAVTLNRNQNVTTKSLSTALITLQGVFAE